jgi:hypothetical protein
MKSLDPAQVLRVNPNRLEALSQHANAKSSLSPAQEAEWVKPTPSSSSLAATPSCSVTFERTGSKQ